MEKSYTKSAIQICGECMGEGQTWVNTSPPRHGSDTGTGFWQTCPTCQGVSIVKVTKHIVITVEPHLLKINQQHE